MSQPDTEWVTLAGFGYTVATGELWCPMAQFHELAEATLGRPILTHEFADEELWDELREQLRAQMKGSK